MSGDCLLSWNRTRIDNDAAKLTLIRTADARVAMGFTGLAALNVPSGHRGPAPAGAFRTVTWLIDLANGAAGPDYVLLPMLDRMADAMSKDWPPPGAPAEGRLLSVGFTGFRYAGGLHLPVLAIIQNVEPTAGGFRIAREFHVEHREAPALMALGLHKVITDADLADLKRVIETQPADAVRQVLVAVTRRAASSKTGANVVGDIIQSIAIPSDPTMSATVDYHAPNAWPYFALPHSLDARGRPDDLMLLDLRYRGGEPSGPLRDITFPRPKRGHPCTCGSGMPWRACHGDTRRKNRSSETQISIGPYRLPFGPADDPTTDDCDMVQPFA